MPRPRKDSVPPGTAATPTLPASFHAGAIDLTAPKAAQLYDLIRRAIVNLHLPPGSPLNERAICGRLGISKTPLREAILQLAAENLVVVVPNSGTFVARINLRDVFDGELIREALELKVVGLAAERVTADFLRALALNLHHQEVLAAANLYDDFYAADEDMHRLICCHGASLRVWHVANSAKAQLDRVRRLAIPQPGHLGVILEEHRAIVDGLRRSDHDAAEAAMQSHLTRVFDTVRKLIATHREYFELDTLAVLNDYGETEGTRPSNPAQSTLG